jgi:hypothetical protein
MIEALNAPQNNRPIKKILSFLIKKCKFAIHM